MHIHICNIKLFYRPATKKNAEKFTNCVSIRITEEVLNLEINPMTFP